MRARRPNPVHTEHASANSTTMLRVSTAAHPLSHASTNGGLGRPAALAGARGPRCGSAKSVNELEDIVSRSPRRALRQVALRTSPEVAPNYGHPAALLTCSGIGAARAAGACWRPLWPQRKGGAVWRVKATIRCIGYLRSLMRALPAPSSEMVVVTPQP